MTLPWANNHGSGHQLSMDPGLANCLNYAGVSHFQDSLNAWGIETTGDLCWLLLSSDEWPLQMGMTRLQHRKLLNVCTFIWMRSTRMRVESTLDEVHERSKVETAMADAETAALDRLNDSLGVATMTDLPHWIINNINEATKEIRQPSPEQAMQALHLLCRAVDHCPAQELKLKQKLQEAKRRIRDVLVWRIQEHVRRGDRRKFLEELQRVSGDLFDKKLKSECLHAHRQTIAENFPAFAWPYQLAVWHVAICFVCRRAGGSTNFLLF